MVTVYVTWWFLTFFDNFFSVRCPLNPAAVLFTDRSVAAELTGICPCSLYISRFLDSKCLAWAFSPPWCLSSSLVCAAPGLCWTALINCYPEARHMQRFAHAGAFASSWLGGLALQLGEWIIKKLPLVKHIYSAAKQVGPLRPSPQLACLKACRRDAFNAAMLLSCTPGCFCVATLRPILGPKSLPQCLQVSGALNPGNEQMSFRECVIIRHPRQGEFAIGFITGQTILQVRSRALRIF